MRFGSKIVRLSWPGKIHRDALVPRLCSQHHVPDKVSLTFDIPDRARDGCRNLTETRDSPEESFEGQQRETPWNDIHVVYFVGGALWTYRNTPFLYTYEGFTTEEIPSIHVEGGTWRLKVTFPDIVKSHTRERISCFGPDGVLRRHDYTVDILGGATGLNYASD
jgi:hypothetical protein